MTNTKKYNLLSLILAGFVTITLFTGCGEKGKKYDSSRFSVGMSKEFTFDIDGRIYISGNKKTDSHTAEGHIAMHKTDLVLRIAKEQQLSPTKYRYTIDVTPYLPGKYDLKDYITACNGYPDAVVPSCTFEAHMDLTKQEREESDLISNFDPEIPMLNTFYYWFGAGVVVWVLGWIPIIFLGRRKKQQAQQAPEFSISFAEQLAPLVNLAASGKLNRIGKAKLELLLLATWKQKLCKGTETMAQAMQIIRKDPTAGELINSVEQWLHRPVGSYEVDVEKLLAPYRNMPAVSESQLEEAAR